MLIGRGEAEEAEEGAEVTLAAREETVVAVVLLFLVDVDGGAEVMVGVELEVEVEVADKAELVVDVTAAVVDGSMR